MWRKNKEINLLTKLIHELLDMMQRGNFLEWSYLLGNKKEIIKRNLLAGIFRGIGIGIGVTVITAVLIFALQKIVALNIPVIGEFISDIVEIVEKNQK